MKALGLLGGKERLPSLVIIAAFIFHLHSIMLVGFQYERIYSAPLSRNTAN